MKRICKWKHDNDTIAVTGNVYYIDTLNGSDSNGGLTRNNAFKTIAYAESQLSNGDVLLSVYTSGDYYRPSASKSEFYRYRIDDILYTNEVWIGNSSTGYGTWSPTYSRTDLNIYYVRSTGGSDSNDGLSYENAFLTLSHAQSVAVSGDTIYLEGDFARYEETQTSNRTDWITYIAYGTGASIDGLYINNASNYDCYLRFDGIDFARNNDSSITSTNIPTHNIWEAVDANYIEMRECEVHEYLDEYMHTDKAVRFTGDYVLFYKCHIHASQSGIWGVGDNYTISQCYVHNTAGGPCITLFGTNWIVENNNLNDSTWVATHTCAIHTGVTYNYVEGGDASGSGYDGTGNNEDYDGQTVGCAYIREFTELTLNPHNSGIAVWNGSGIIRKNIVHDCGNTSGINFYPNYVDYYSDILIENNLVYDTHNQIYPNNFQECGNNIVIRNNTFIGSLRNPSGLTYARNRMYGAAAFSFGSGYDGTGVYFYNNICLGHTSGWTSNINTKNNILWSITGYPSTLTDNTIVCDPTALLAAFDTEIAYFITNFFNGVDDYANDLAYGHGNAMDFTLDSLSAAINAGNTNYQPSDSLGSISSNYIQNDGISRSLSKYSVGCYEV